MPKRLFVQLSRAIIAMKKLKIKKSSFLATILLLLVLFSAQTALVLAQENPPTPPEPPPAEGAPPFYDTTTMGSMSTEDFGQGVGNIKVKGCVGLGFFSNFLTCAIAWGSIGISAVLAFIVGIGVMIATWFVGFVLSLNLRILDGSNTLIEVGWKITRDIANLGFVLVIIIIAFATILRRPEQYGANKLLPKLIAAAILVNFSLTIAGVFIDFSHVLTNFFLNKIAGGNPFKLASTLAAAFQPQRFYVGSASDANSFSPSLGDVTHFGTTLLLTIAQPIFTTIFALALMLVLLAFAFMLLLRYLWLSFLLLISPMIWLFWIIPSYSKHFSAWWNKFLEWVFFAPAVTFFIYLAILSARGLSGAVGEIEAQNTVGFFDMAFAGIQKVAIQGAEMVVLIGIMIGGLIAAQKMGIAGANAAVGAAKGAGNGLKTFAGNRAQMANQRVAQSKAAQKVSAGTAKVGGLATKLGRGFKIQKSDSFLLKAAKVAGNVLTVAPRLGLQGIGGGLTGAEKQREKIAKEPIRPVSLMDSVSGGMKEGSGLFKKKPKKLPRDLAGLQAKFDELQEQLGRTTDEAKREAIQDELDDLDNAIERVKRRGTRTRGTPSEAPPATSPSSPSTSSPSTPPPSGWETTPSGLVTPPEIQSEKRETKKYPPAEEPGEKPPTT